MNELQQIQVISLRTSFAILFLACSGLWAAAAEGTIRFATFVEGIVNAPVTGPAGTAGPALDGTGASRDDVFFGVGPKFKAQLFLVNGSGPNAVYIPLYPMTSFRDGSAGLRWMRYVQEPTEPVKVPGFSAGQEVQIVMRAFNRESYESSLADPTGVWGQSAIVNVRLGGKLPTGQVLPPVQLAGLQGFIASLLTPPRQIVANVIDKDLMTFYYTDYCWGSCPTLLEKTTNFTTWTVATNFADFRIPLDRSSSPTFFRLRRNSP